MRVLAQPAVPGNFEKVGALTGIGDEDALQKIASMRGDVFGEGERGRDDILVEEVNVVAFGVGRIVVKRQVSGQHGILHVVGYVLADPHRLLPASLQLTRMTPQLQTSTFLPVYKESLTTNSGAA